MSSGTLSDKISALTLLVQESPLHTTKALENLLSLAKKRSRDQAMSALGALKDLFAQGELLPVGRKLRAFPNQSQLLEALQSSSATTWNPSAPLPSGLSETHLLVWAYEDWLKVIYYDVIRLLEVWCNDEVEFARGRALSYVYELLTQKPEQEVNLLRLLVNKLGDLDKKIASKASFLLLQLATIHPQMKSVIILSMEAELIFRPRQSLHAIYYATITLNQTVLSGREVNIAVKLLGVYFRLFTMLLKDSNGSNGHLSESLKQPEKQIQDKMVASKSSRGAKVKNDTSAALVQTEEDSKEKIISAVLTGVNRAFPYAGSDSSM